MQCLLRGRGVEGWVFWWKNWQGELWQKGAKSLWRFQSLESRTFPGKKTTWLIFGRSWFLCREKWQHLWVTKGIRQFFGDLFKSITWEKYGPIFTFPVDHYTSAPPPEILFVLYSQHLSCRYPTKMDTPIIWTAAKSLVKINYRSLTEISFCYYGLSLMRTLTQGPCIVLYKGSWLYYCMM